MKSKIIIIVVAAVCITGASFATGVAIDRHNSRETSILASEAISSAVSDALNSTVTTQTITVSEAGETSEPSATAAQTTTEASTTKAKIINTTKKKTTTKKTTTAEVKENSYSYCFKPYKKAIINEKETMVYKIGGIGPDVGKYCYQDDSNKTIYIDDISTIEFIE